MKISVIIPVYNAVGSLQRSLDCLARQTSRNFEAVIIDDCSTDGSDAIIDTFAVDSGVICRVKHLSDNKGVANARNEGLAMADGEYVAWLDADDSVPDNWLEKCSHLVEQHDADIIGWDWTLGFERNGRYMRQAEYDSPIQAVKNMMGGTMRWNLWMFLTKRSLIEASNIGFVAGADIGEDMMFMLRAFLKAKSVIQLHESLYFYNAANTASISHQFSEKRRLEVEENLTLVQEAIDDSTDCDHLGEYLDYLKLYLKLPLLVCAEKENYMTWYNWFPESNKSAMRNKALPFRTRLLQFMGAHKMWLGVRAYYFIVYKFVYGLIYR